MGVGGGLRVGREGRVQDDPAARTLHLPILLSSQSELAELAATWRRIRNRAELIGKSVSSATHLVAGSISRAQAGE